MAGNTMIPAPGSVGVAVVQDILGGGVEVLSVQVFSPPPRRADIVLVTLFAGVHFADVAAARQAVSGALASNPVVVAKV